MKIAILMLCHKNPEQINLFLEKICGENITVFIHIDKKSDFKDRIIKHENVYILPDELRENVEWADISQVKATFNLINYAYKTDKYDFFWLCSGQDFPIKSSQYIISFFEKYAESNFINIIESNNTGDKYNKYDKRNDMFYFKWMNKRNIIMRVIKRMIIELTGGYNKTYKIFKRKNIYGIKFYYGSQWWCMNNSMIQWIFNYLEENNGYYDYYVNSLCPDESFFQTLFMSSPYASTHKEYLHYIDWSENKNSPKTLCMEDYPNIKDSTCLMARKFDINKDGTILELLIK